MTDYSNVNKERIRLWVAALRSGEFHQSVKALRGYVRVGDQVVTGHCCLDVANIVAQRAGVRQPHNYPLNETNVDTDFTALTPSTASWFGFASGGSDSRNPLLVKTLAMVDPHSHSINPSLMWLNDQAGKDFNEIADVIEEEWLND